MKYKRLFFSRPRSFCVVKGTNDVDAQCSLRTYEAFMSDYVASILMYWDREVQLHIAQKLIVVD